jgi:hypothetical protein
MGLSRKTALRAGIVLACLGVFIAALLVPQGGPRQSSGPSFAIQKALAGDFSGQGGLADRQLLGLFSENVTDNMKVKIPASEQGQVRNVRIFCKWKMVEANGKGQFAWGRLDEQVNSALSVGVNSILLSICPPVPVWATNPGNPKPTYMGPPKRIQDFGDFCGAVAERYKGYVDYYQIWNEPGWDINSQAAAENKIYYAGDCEWSYLGMLRSAYQAIKAKNPGAFVISGSLLQGLTRSGDNFTPYETLLKGANQDVSMKIDANMNVVAERPMYFNYHGSWTGGTVELGVKKPRTTWFLAEGATHPGFEEWICIQNPGSTGASVHITYMFPGGRTQDQWVNVGANTRYTVDVNAAVGPNKDVSARVDASVPVVVERPIYFMYHGAWDGGSIGSGVAELSKTWYLAEGATQPGFEEWISLMNPSSASAHVAITYMFPGGATKVQHVTMAPTSRETVLVNNVVGPNKDVSAKVEADQMIIAERPMYFLYHGAWSGGDSQVGATAPNTSWFLSEGTTRSNSTDGAFEEWISIQNPGNTFADVNFKYMFPGGATQGDTKRIPPHARETVLVNGVVGPNKDVSVQLNSTQPIVVERPMYFNYHNNISGGDVELGCTAASSRWYFAEGTTRAGFDEWTTLQNPNAATATAKITFMFSDGTTQEKWVTLAPNSRTTVGVNGALSMGNVCDAFAIHPYDYPEYWAWYSASAINICQKYGFGNKEMTVTEIGWPHAGRAEFSPEGQRAAIGEVGVGGLWSVGVKKIWIFEDIDPASSWDAAYNGLFDHSGNAQPAWNEYKHWQTLLPNFGNKPNHLW